jgi:membrane-bound lytic murein transglycosylase B
MKCVYGRHILLSVLAIFILTVPCLAFGEPEDFDVWLSSFREEARAMGISEETLDAALSGIRPIQKVIELDRNQPEFKKDFWDYIDVRVSENRISQGMKLLLEHEELLERIQYRYGVPSRFLVAIWGLESNYGRTQGKFPVIGSLVTLAHDERRSDFFRAQLLNALVIVDEGHIGVSEMLGSWAGAMGQIQFMPSTFVSYATDGNNDGRKDIWQSFPDIFESAAHYLAEAGWERGYTWGREVLIPAGFQSSLASLETGKLLSEWQEMGVRRINGDNLPDADIKAYLVLPAGNEGPAFLVYENYKAILKWNRSHFYAIAVGHLADRLTGRSPLQSSRTSGQGKDRTD